MISLDIASKLLTRSKTVHLALKLGLPLTNVETTICKIDQGTAKEPILEVCKLIVWAKYTIVHKAATASLN